MARRPLAIAAAASMFAVVNPGTAVAQTGACAKTEFETAVGDAAEALQALTQQSTPAFQDRLRALKDKRQWTHEQFMTEAAPLVQDERIAAFDDKSAELLSRINSMGAEGSARRAPDCTLLTELRASMKLLVDTQKAKWAYMFDKVDKELAR